MIRNSKGFTLIELMIVVVIIGILAAIAIPKFSLVALRTKQAEAGPVLKQLCMLAEAQMYKNDNNAWPTDQDELEGWQAPSESFFTFTLAGSTAYATTTTAGLVDQEMNCTTKAISNS